VTPGWPRSTFDEEADDSRVDLVRRVRQFLELEDPNGEQFDQRTLNQHLEAVVTLAIQGQCSDADEFLQMVTQTICPVCSFRWVDGSCAIGTRGCSLRRNLGRVLGVIDRAKANKP